KFRNFFRAEEPNSGPGQQRLDSRHPLWPWSALPCGRRWTRPIASVDSRGGCARHPHLEGEPDSMRSRQCFVAFGIVLTAACGGAESTDLFSDVGAGGASAFTGGAPGSASGGSPVGTSAGATGTSSGAASNGGTGGTSGADGTGGIAPATGGVPSGGAAGSAAGGASPGGEAGTGGAEGGRSPAGGSANGGASGGDPS